MMQLEKFKRIANLETINEEDIEKYFIEIDVEADITGNGIRIKNIPSVYIDIENMRDELNSLKDKYEYSPKSDVEGAIIVWKYTRDLPPYLFGSKGEMLWLAFECREYINYRWVDEKKNKINSSRFIFKGNANDRHAISRLYWAAKLLKGDEKLIQILFSVQDIALNILERAWSHSENAIIWFLEYLQNPLKELDLDYELDYNEFDVTIMDHVKNIRIRQIIKIFYARLSLYHFDDWDEDKFKSELKNTIEFSLNLFNMCREHYRIYCERNNIEKRLPISQLDLKIVALYNPPTDVTKWIRELHQ